MNWNQDIQSRLESLIGAELDVATGFPGVRVGTRQETGNGGLIECRTPIDGSEIATVSQADSDQVSAAVTAAESAFVNWRMVPAPRRGEFVRRFGNRLRDNKEELAFLVSLECGKIYAEALGEVQEMIDICDFAVGLSRQLYGLSIASERPLHRLTEQWHPLGPIGCISAFNFPVAVWAWNAALAWVCGDPVIWKPSEKTPLCALACQNLVAQVMQEIGDVPDGISIVITGAAPVGKQLADSTAIPLVSATGSVPMGRAVAGIVARRLGRCLLELGGNNAAIVTESAELDLAARAIVFSAVGTCGQRCTTLRRLIVHRSRKRALLDRLEKAYASLPIGNPLEPSTLVGPLIDQKALDGMQAALKSAVEQGGHVVIGGNPAEMKPELGSGAYVHPAIIGIDPNAPIVQQEVFAPLLYVMEYEDFADAIAIQNGVPQGLSSAVFTTDVRQAEYFCSPAGSDCGIANVNIGTSGAEIGGAFGGEKETGGGRESGSDAWKSYMRRATNTVNYSHELPLAQGIVFGGDGG